MRILSPPPANFQVHRGLGGAATLALCFLFVYFSLFILPLLSSLSLLLLSLPTPPFPLLSPGVYVHVPPSVTGPVSCQVSSLLALSMSQRSDKSEPGVGLSLPLATEVSFSPSIIHILFNLTRWKWPRSVRTSSHGGANAGGRRDLLGGEGAGGNLPVGRDAAITALTPNFTDAAAGTTGDASV